VAHLVFSSTDWVFFYYELETQMCIT